MYSMQAQHCDTLQVLYAV